MPLADDGDLVRAYGFVAIRFATLEDSIDDRLRQAEPLLTNVSDKQLDNILRWKFSDRVKVLRKLFGWATTNGPDFAYKGEQLHRAEQTLSACFDAAKIRNDTLHSPIIADLRTGEVIRHSRFGFHRVEAAEVYRLANQISCLDSGVGHMRFTVNSMLERPRLS